MYRFYQKGHYKVMHYEFESLNHFLGYLAKTPINDAVFSEKMLVSLRKNNDAWFGTSNFDEAVNLAKYGDHQSFLKFQELKIELERFLQMSVEKNLQHNDYVGYVPDVKSYLEGHPLTMFNKEREMRKRISIYFNSANFVEVTQKQIYNRGVITLSLIELLEKMGYSVELNLFSMSKQHDEIHYANFKMKLESEKLNAQKLFFPMCHPSWFRRLIFNLREKTPDITSGWRFGYGSTCGEADIREMIHLGPEDIVIARPDEMGISGRNILDDAKNMFTHIDESNKGDKLHLESKIQSNDASENI